MSEAAKTITVAKNIVCPDRGYDKRDVRGCGEKAAEYINEQDDNFISYECTATPLLASADRASSTSNILVLCTGVLKPK